MIKKLSPKELKVGMITLEAIVTPLGQPIAPAGETLTRQIINKMKLYIITGPAGVGKSTISKGIASSSSKSVLIEGDEIYHHVGRWHGR